MPNFFRMFGSGFKNEPSPLPEKYRFTRHSFPEYTPDPTPSSRSKRRPGPESIYTFKEWMLKQSKKPRGCQKAKKGLQN